MIFRNYSLTLMTAALLLVMMQCGYALYLLTPSGSRSLERWRHEPDDYPLIARKVTSAI